MELKIIFNEESISLQGVMKPDEKEKVLLTVIAQSRFDQVVKMVRNGYPLTVPVMEALRNSGADAELEEILKEDFDWADFSGTEQYLRNLLGPEQAAKLFCYKYRAGHNGGRLLVSRLSANELVANEMWEELFLQKQWKLLVDNGQADMIIRNLNKISHPEKVKAAANFRTREIAEYILQLGFPQWLAYMPAYGPARLIRDKQFQLLYELRKWIPDQPLEKEKLLAYDSNFHQAQLLWHDAEIREKYSADPWLIILGCYTEGRKVLLEEKEYNTLIALQQHWLLAQAGLWHILAEDHAYDSIDWDKWLADEHQRRQEHRRDRLDYLYACAADAKQFGLLEKEKQRRLLFRKGQYKRWLKTFCPVRTVRHFADWFEKQFEPRRD